MDHAVRERRRDARFAHPPLGDTRAMLRPGRTVSVIDVSAGGALVETDRPLRPGGRVHFQLVAGARTSGLAAHVLRCTVSALHPLEGVRYRGALRFEQRCELQWEHAALVGLTPSGAPKAAPEDRAKSVPAAAPFGPKQAVKITR